MAVTATRGEKTRGHAESVDAHRDRENQTRPVFVDASGRRSRTFRRFGWAVAVVCACYATTVAASLVGGSSSAPFLLIPGVPEGVAEAAEVKEEKAEVKQPSWEPTIPNGTLPADWGWEPGVVPPSATAAPAEAAEVGVEDSKDSKDGAGDVARGMTPAGGAATGPDSDSASGSDSGSGSGSDSGKDADSAPTPSASGATPPAGDNSGTPPADPQDDSEGNGNPVDGLLGGLLGLPPLLGG